jgi:hypothetical protein
MPYAEIAKSAKTAEKKYEFTLGFVISTVSALFTPST